MNTEILLRSGLAGLLLAGTLAASGCGGETEDSTTEQSTAVTVVWPEAREVEDIEVATGRIEAVARPVVAAETAGRIERIVRDAGDPVSAGDLLAELDAQSQRIAVNSARARVRRLEALTDNQRVQVGRLEDLAQRQSVSQDQLDEARVQLQAFSAQLDEAEAMLEDADFNLERTRIRSPVTGSVQRRLVSAGDFVSIGHSLFEVVAADALRVVLALPERLQHRLEPGQVVRLSTPARPQSVIEAEISEIRPSVDDRSGAVELIVALDNPGGWRPGGSVSAQVVLARREGVVVPSGSLVRRPAGEVVYVVDGEERAEQRVVRTGVRRAGWVEIREGLAADEPVVLDGAGFLSDGVALDIGDWEEIRQDEDASP